MTTTDASTSNQPTDDGVALPGLVWLEPTSLVEHPLNVREDITDASVRDLAATIRAVGVLEPLVVTPTEDGDGWKIVAGHRRARAAVLAHLTQVPCVTRADLSGDSDAVIAALGENLRRKALTSLQEAKGYQQLLDLGVSRTRIARTTGSTTNQVRAGLAVHASKPAADAVARGLTLDQAAALVEFEDDPDTVERLTQDALRSDGAFRHALARERQDRENQAKHRSAQAALTEAGVIVLDSSRSERWPNATALWRLRDDDGNDGDVAPIEVSDHERCPGHAALVDQWNPERIEWYCTDPDAHGHHQRFRGTSQTRGGPLTEDEKEARRTVVANNKAWRAAETVRREYVGDLLARKRPPRGTLRWVVGEIMARPDRVGDGKDGLLAEILRQDTSTGTYGRAVGSQLHERATDVRLPLVLLAQVAADREASMDVHTWRQLAPSDEARWLAWLASTGYVLSEIEQQVVDNVYGTADDDPTEEALQERHEPSDTHPGRDFLEATGTSPDADSDLAPVVDI